MSDRWNRVQALVGSGFSNLREAKIAIVGLGSLGSLTAVQLAMTGIGNFTLIDPDVLEGHNVVRHAADLRYVGLPKVVAIEDLIKNRNPDARVIAIQGNVFDNIDVLESVDFVLVAGLGSEISTTNLAIKLRELNKVAIYGGVYERAVAGEVFAVHPVYGPCYSCFASRLREAGPELPEKEVDYGMPLDELKAQPGLGVHINRISTVFADWAIRYALRSVEVLPYFPGNLAILSSEEYTFAKDVNGRSMKLPPHSARWFVIKKLPDCLVCGESDVSFTSMEELDKELSDGCTEP